MTIKIKIIFIMAVVLLVVFRDDSLAGTAKSWIAKVEVQSGRSFAAPVTVGPVENLAGVKLVLQYDPNILIYVKSEKSKNASQLMQVVNDKTPGKLIIVMAGAKGLSGKNLELLCLYFKAAAGLKEKIITKIQTIEIELVSDQLKGIPCQLSESEITVVPEMN
jgi:hypothetical protein